MGRAVSLAIGRKSETRNVGPHTVAQMRNVCFKCDTPTIPAVKKTARMQNVDVCMKSELTERIPANPKPRTIPITKDQASVGKSFSRGGRSDIANILQPELLLEIQINPQRRRLGGDLSQCPQAKCRLKPAPQKLCIKLVEHYRLPKVTLSHSNHLTDLRNLRFLASIKKLAPQASRSRGE